MIGFLDDIFCRLEGKPTKKKPTAKKVSKGPKGEGLGSLLYKLFVSKEYKDKGLAGWKDDKEKFKLDLINDIKDFLFTKWEKPWIAGLIFDEKGRVVSGFRNIYGRVFKEQGNVLGLERNKGESPYFITLNKVTELKATVLDRSKFTTILSYIPIFKDKGKASEKPDYMLPKFHSVINIDFVDGIKKPIFKVTDFKNLELNEYVERFIEQLKLKGRIPKLVYDQADRAYYTHSQTSWGNDSIHLAPIKQLKNIEGYYSVLFHEITHSTMNPTRCGRGKNGKKAVLLAVRGGVVDFTGQVAKRCLQLILGNRGRAVDKVRLQCAASGKFERDVKRTPGLEGGDLRLGMRCLRFYGGKPLGKRLNLRCLGYCPRIFRVEESIGIKRRLRHKERLFFMGVL